MKDCLEYVARQFVEHPDKVTVTRILGTKTAVFELRCHEEDVGRLIGKNGKTIAAIRSLMNVLASRYRRKAVVEVVD